MPGQNLITVLRGLKVRVSTMDAFLHANGKPHGTDGTSFVPFNDSDTPDEISVLLREKAGSNDMLYVVPSIESHDRSSHVYVAYSYAHVYAQRCINADDPTERIPEGFEKLREEILKLGGDDEEGRVGLFVVYTDQPGPDPPDLAERRKASSEFRPLPWWDISIKPIHCGICDETFDCWTKRQWHRKQTHGLDEPLNALPENA